MPVGNIFYRFAFQVILKNRDKSFTHTCSLPCIQVVYHSVSWILFVLYAWTVQLVSAYCLCYSIRPNCRPSGRSAHDLTTRSLVGFLQFWQKRQLLWHPVYFTVHQGIYSSRLFFQKRTQNNLNRSVSVEIVSIPLKLYNIERNRPFV